MAWHEQVRDAASRQAQGEAAADQRGKNRQELADTVTVAANLAAGPTISLAFEQLLCLC
jgi:hypothetical protein